MIRFLNIKQLVTTLVDKKLLSDLDSDISRIVISLSFFPNNFCYTSIFLIFGTNGQNKNSNILYNCILFSQIIYIDGTGDD